jgi:hypothetical protein
MAGPGIGEARGGGPPIVDIGGSTWTLARAGEASRRAGANPASSNTVAPAAVRRNEAPCGRADRIACSAEGHYTVSGETRTLSGLGDAQRRQSDSGPVQ